MEEASLLANKVSIISKKMPSKCKISCVALFVRHLHPPTVTICLLTNGVFLFSLHRRTHLLFGMFTYDWIYCLLLFDSLNTSFIELYPTLFFPLTTGRGDFLLLIFAY